MSVQDNRGKPGLLGRFMRAAQYVTTGRFIDGVGIGFFGPGNPIAPMAPADEAGRRMDYPVFTNTNLQIKEVDLSIGFEDLEALAEYHDVTRLLIETRKDQLEALEWTIRPKRRAGEDVVESDSDMDRRIEQSLVFFEKPDGIQPFAVWLRLLLEDLLVFDAPTLYMNTDNPLAWRFQIISGKTIKRLIGLDGRTPEPPVPAYQQKIKGLPAWDYTTEEMIYLPRNPRPHKVYGMSPVQQIIILVNIALRRQASQLEYYTEGNIPDSLIGTPKEWTPEQIIAYQKFWDSINAGNTAERRRAKFVPGEAKIMQTRDPHLKDEFDEWLVRVACYAFNQPPTAFVKQMNRATAQTAKETAEAEGLAPFMRWVKMLMDECLSRLGQDDLEFSYVQNEEQDPEVHIGLLDKQVRNGTMTINEAREEMGRDPVDGGDIAMVYMGTQPVPVSLAADPPPPPVPMLPGPQNGPPGADDAPGQADKDGKGKPPGKAPVAPGKGKKAKPTDAADKVAKGGALPLLIKRPVTNADDIRDWAESQGFASALPAEDMHVTIVCCKTPVDWEGIPDHVSNISARGYERTVEYLGQPTPSGDRACVLMFESKRLSLRWDELQTLGITSDYDSYTPHVTISYSGAPEDLDGIEPYDGPIHLGPEVFKEFKSNWSDDLKEEGVGKVVDRPFAHPAGLGIEKEFNPDQPRDDHGRWGEGEGGGPGLHDPGVKLTSTDERAYEGKQVTTVTTLSKQATGELGEKVAIAYLQSTGMTDAKPLNLTDTNFPVDAVGDHELIEVKAGLVSNGESAQQWRATIGRPGPNETAWLRQASASDKRAWNEAKQTAILDRKEAVVREFSGRLGTPIMGKTLTMIINPDTHVADIYMHDGFHSRIGWNSDAATKAYKGSFKY